MNDLQLVIEIEEVRRDIKALWQLHDSLDCNGNTELILMKNRLKTRLLAANDRLAFLAAKAGVRLPSDT